LHDPGGAMDDAARGMLQRVKFVGREDWTDMEAGRHAIVTIKTRGGRTLSEDVWHRPMSGNELERKFDALVVPRFGREKAAQVARQLLSLETAESVKPLMSALGSA
jgi:hypothetical protein